MCAPSPFAEDTAMLRVLFAILICSTCGCGTFTCLNLDSENPRVETIYGGVRTDVNCIVGNRVTPKGKLVDWDFGPAGQCVLKTCSVIDLPLSLAADTLLLPYTIWLTVKKNRVSEQEAHEGVTSEEPKEKTLDTSAEK
jgi:uncharacterized protein YceK